VIGLEPPAFRGPKSAKSRVRAFRGAADHRLFDPETDHETTHRPRGNGSHASPPAHDRRRGRGERALSYLLPTSAADHHVGTFVKTTSAQVIEVLGGSGLDFAVLDAEHAPFDRASLDAAFIAGRAVGLPLFVRVLERTAAGLLSVLDMGAAGLLVPHVDTEQDAREVVAHCRYVGGDRGYSSSPRAAGYGALGMKEAIAQGDRNVVICQIESVMAVENAARIASVPGVGGLFIGRADLALSMGLQDAQDPRVIEATQAVVRSTLAAGKAVGMFVGSTAERERYVAAGASWFVQGSDQSMLGQAARSIARPRRLVPMRREATSGPDPVADEHDLAPPVGGVRGETA
jgi:2-keto-3-deoxy-L-rhamnonate aldolase RhmA